MKAEEFNTSSRRLQIALNILFVKTDLRFCKITIFYDIRKVNKCQWVFRTSKVAMRVSNSYIKEEELYSSIAAMVMIE